MLGEWRGRGGNLVGCLLFSQFFLAPGHIDKCLFILPVIRVMGDKVLKTSQCCLIATGLEIEMPYIKLILCKVDKTSSDSSLGH